MSESARLSRNLLRMKFMQRCLDAETKKQLEDDERRIISDEHWYLELPELRARESLVVEEQSFVPCEELRFGRLSFRGFNPEVEKLMALLNPKDEEEEEEEEEQRSRMQTDVTDEEMARRYDSLVRSMKSKFATKRQRSEQEDSNQNVKRTFMKPQD